MKRNIIYIINPISGTGTKKGLQQIIEQKTKREGIGYHIYPSVSSGDYSFLEDIIKENKITDIVIAGGDGTVSDVVGSLMHLKTNFGIIPCGSGNGLALAAGISKQTSNALKTIFRGKAFRTDGFFINKKFACMLCGLGFDAQVAHDFALQPKRGLASYIKQVLRNFLSAKTYSFQIQIGDATLQTEAYFISIANSNQFGNNFTIAPAASLTDGLLDIVIVKKMSKLLLPFSILSQVTGINARQDIHDYKASRNIIYFQTPSLTIINKEEAPLHIDGDPKITASKFEIKVVRNAIKLIQPLKK